MRAILVVPLALFACDPAVQCGSTQGFITGTVSGGSGTVTVFAQAQGQQTVTTTADSSGDYELNVEGGVKWTISASSASDEDTGIGGTTCFSEDEVVQVKACKEYTVDLTISTDCITADKPNLYLYPTVDTPMTVTLRHDPRQDVFASDPPYDGGWKGVAHPDGTFTTEAVAKAPFLFYEITVLPAQARGFQHRDVVCIPGEGAVAAMAELLGAYGFNQRERDDFVDAWTGTLPWAERYAVYPQRSVDHVVALELDPALPVERLWFVVEDGEDCKPRGPAPKPLERGGAHGVEWGVVLHGLE